MMRKIIDSTRLDAFASGMARATGLRVSVFDADGIRISPDAGEVAADMLDRVPAASAPPAALDGEPTLTWIEQAGIRFILCPVQTEDSRVGFVALARGAAESERPADEEDRAAQAALWAAQLLADWYENESRLVKMSGELSLIGDISELLTGGQDLQSVLDDIVRETSRVMNCRYASLRLYNEATGELHIAAAYNLSQRYQDRGVILRKESPIDDAALTGELVYIEDAATDMRIRFRDEVRRLGIRSGLTAGLIHHGRALGVLRIYADRPRRFGAADRRVLLAVASQAATAIDNARLIEARLRSVALERQVALAGDVQTRIMRTRPPQHDVVETAMIYVPSSHLSGDICDVFTLANGQLAAVIGDAVGHGPAAAMLMASVRGAVRAVAETTSDLAELVGRLNRHACRDTSPAEFVTMIAIAVDAAGRTLRYCNAGHEAVLLLRRGQLMAPEEGSLVLGLDPEERYHEYRLELQPEDFLLLYTDGVVEAMNFHGELFGRRRLLKLVKRYGHLSPEQALRSIHWDIRRFAGLADQSDDQTLIALRVRR